MMVKKQGLCVWALLGTRLLPWAFAVSLNAGSPVLPEAVDGFVCCVS